MKWKNHQMVTGAVVLAVTASIPAAIIAGIASVVPDAIEGHGSNNNPLSEEHMQWQRRHRQGSHWFVPYLAGALIFFIFAHFKQVHGFTALTHGRPTDDYGTVALAAAWICIGCLAHIVEDLFCGKVPGFNLKQRIGYRAFYVGSGKEYFISMLIVALSAGVIYIRRGCL